MTDPAGLASGALAPDSADEAVLLRALAELVAAGRVRLAVDRRKLSHIDFPLGLEADGNLWAYPLVALTGLAFWFWGAVPGIVAALAALVLYQIFARAHIARRLDRRIRERGLTSVATWRRLWRFGGVILIPEGGASCQGPGESWTALVRGLGAGGQPSDNAA